ncbi:MAG: hypothetical protein JKY54_16540 [Flavobacteriales bacterium]|nr:hypothetical protein [Flavobacteriales bacterium]
MKFKLAFLLLIVTASCSTDIEKPDHSTTKLSSPSQPEPVPRIGQKIQVTLILDTSNSMDGLIEQAKSQLWTIVNHISRLKINNEQPQIEISLYEYGNDRLDYRKDYVKKLTNLTTELDSVSERLFALRTDGGEEFCGAVLHQSLSQLEWKNDKTSYKVIFIAGNESFDQGITPFITSCELAKNKDVFINTIFCGDPEEGIRTHWKKGAKNANGVYMSIAQNETTTYIESPYDDSILSLNDSLNDTYMYYGSLGRTKFSNIGYQDYNASKYGSSNSVNRTVSKSGAAYFNKTWDLVDAHKEANFEVDSVDKSGLQKEYQELNSNQLLAEIQRQSERRAKFQKMISAYNKKRIAYTDEIRLNENPDGLEYAIVQAIKTQAASKGFTYD